MLRDDDDDDERGSASLEAVDDDGDDEEEEGDEEDERRFLFNPYRLTYQDWLRYPDGGRQYELFQGELVMVPAFAIHHQRISRNLGFQLITFLQQKGLGEVFDAPIGVKLSEYDVVEPDLVVVLAENAHRIGEQVIEGPPDIVIEILSPESAAQDQGRKRVLYEQAGVREYWLVDPETASIEVLSLKGGQYVCSGIFEDKDALKSPLLKDQKIFLHAIFPAG